MTTTTTYKNVQQEDGTYKKIPETTVASILVSNPLTEQVKMNNLNLSRLRKQQDEFVQKKIGVEDNLRGELLTNVGFLEELNAMLEDYSYKERGYGVLYYHFFIFAVFGIIRSSG